MDDDVTVSSEIQDNEETNLLKEVQGKAWPVRMKRYFRLSGPGCGCKAPWRWEADRWPLVFFLFLGAVGITEWREKQKRLLHHKDEEASENVL